MQRKGADKNPLIFAGTNSSISWSLPDLKNKMKQSILAGKDKTAKARTRVSWRKATRRELFQYKMLHWNRNL